MVNIFAPIFSKYLFLLIYTMKESLVNLLFEEYKQICLFDDLAKKGIDLNSILVQNSEIVFDLVGFPKDNTTEYDFHMVNGFPHDPKNGKMVDDKMFCRDWLIDKYYDLVDSIEKKQKIEVVEKGLRMVEYNDEKLIKEKLLEFVDWLYQEYEDKL